MPSASSADMPKAANGGLTPGRDASSALVRSSGRPRIHVCSAQSITAGTCHAVKPMRFAPAFGRAVHSPGAMPFRVDVKSPYTPVICPRRTETASMAAILHASKRRRMEMGET